MFPELTPHYRQAANPLFCHEDFLSQMEANRGNGVGKRAALLLQRLLLDERREFFKSTQGVNKGWRRSRLGGNHGSHFYAWWAPRGATPLEAGGGFDTSPQGAIFLRAIRHHDDHTPLDPQGFEQSYVPLGPIDMRDESMVPAPWTPQQSKFASARQNVRTLRGFPGSGKTTALWHAAETAGREAILYITYSRDLAILAQDYFAKLVPDHKRFRVVTFPELLRLVAGSQETPEPVRLARARFLKEISAMSPRILGPWVDAKSALYDEIHAHLIGSALPEGFGRWPASGRRLGSKEYRALRERSIGRSAADSALETAEALDKRLGRAIEDVFFPELALAKKGLERLRGPHSGWLDNAGLSGYDCIALDEAQDLTPVESLMLIELARRNQTAKGARNTFLAAGDEAQTVRPTDFGWGWFHDLLHHKLASPADFELRANLRSPQRIAEIVNRVWVLYGHLAKQERPGGSSKAELDDEAGDQVVFCTARPGEELSELLSAFATREGLAIVNLAEASPSWVPEDARPHLLTPSDVKGLDFHSVCLLNGGEFLRGIMSDAARNSTGVSDLSKRLAIDQLRVAVSRPAERLYWLDVDPNGAALKASREMLARTTNDVPQPVVPAVVLKSLEEEALAVEERIRLCEADARQFLGVKPDIAWSRANQAVNLLGATFDPNAVRDPALRQSAHLTCAEIAFCLAWRKVTLSPQLGNPDLFAAAMDHAREAKRFDLVNLFSSLNASGGSSPEYEAFFSIRAVALHPALEPWLKIELQPAAEKWASWADKLVANPSLAHGAAESLPKFFEVFGFPDAAEKSRNVRLIAVETLLEARAHKEALNILQHVPDAGPRLRARALEAGGDLAGAAEIYLSAGAPESMAEDALRCYRGIPDFEKALELAKTMGETPVSESLLWMDQMRKLAASRPANFHKVVLPSEKRLLEDVLETALGATRRKPATKKAAAQKKRPAVKKAARNA